ncbi:hypothetical protein [Actinoplanes solisilvae]|uniref:hypothetical protein n=1 Tax=Actinoplanes solisilvae TaxID=2486853 RepID=UPI000FD8AF41|nr:hypothetical protein [Actinoplanes solisilvae]
MSRQVRQRVTAIVLGGLIFGAPMLANGAASAEEVPEGARQVTFTSGGMFGISCDSRPDVESMTVPAQTTIRVVNQTGYAARLLLAGDTKGTVPDNSATEVIFRRGTTSVVLKPNCAIGDDVSPVLVTASPSASAATRPDPASAAPPADQTPISLAPQGSGNASRTAAGSSAPGLAKPDDHPSRARFADRPGTPQQSSHRSTGSAHAATTAAQAMPHGAAVSRPKVKSKTPSGTPGSAAPAFAGMPPGAEKELLPSAPGLDLEPATVGAEPAGEVPATTEIAAAEPVAVLEPMQEGGSLGLLALTAAVCAMGVGVGAIRAIVSQRANRARMA